MQESQYRLVKHFAKPELGEYIPIGFIEMTKETVAWSSKLKQSIYVTLDMPDAGELKAFVRSMCSGSSTSSR